MAKKLRPLKLFDGERCAALDDNGRQCRNLAVTVERYHGADDLYGFFAERPGMSWVRVPTCAKHSEARK